MVEDGRLVAKYESVMLHRLIRLVWEHRPDIIAVDNVYELGDEREVARFVSLLPENTSIVQVTLLDDGTPVNVKALAASAGIEVQGKLSPSRTAYLLALLASKGYGVRLRFLEEKTKIVVSRSKSPGKGGSSSSRYQRSIRASILRAVKDLKRLLDREGLDYDLVFRKSGGGLDSAVFIVYAPRERLYGLIRPRDDGKVRVEVKPVYSGHVVLETSTKRLEGEAKRYLIVGVDPGTSTGIAAIDLSGRLVFVMSRRGLDRQEAIELVSRYGVPLVVASDVKPAPEYVKKLAAALGAALYEPPEPLSVEEKRELAQRYAEGIKLDPHERDALAAAVKAYNFYADKLKQIESSVARYGIDIDVKRVAASVIKGTSIAEAVEREIANILYSDGEPGYLFRRVRHGSDESEKNSELASAVEKLKKEVEALRAEKKLLEERVEELQREVEDRESELRLLKMEFNAAVEAERRVQQMRHELEVVRGELDKLRDRVAELEQLVNKLSHALLRVSSEGLVAAPNLKTLNRASLKELASLRPRIVRIEDGSSVTEDSVRLLKDAGIRIVVTGDRKLAEALEWRGVVVVPDEVTVEVINGIAILDGSELSKHVMLAYRRMMGSRERDNGISVAKLKKLIEEYRASRMREIIGEELGEVVDG